MVDDPADDRPDFGDDGPDPQEEDLVTEDDVTFFRIGFENKGPCLHVQHVEDRDNEVLDYMDQRRYWTNVWKVSDHGNWMLLQLEDTRCAPR